MSTDRRNRQRANRRLDRRERDLNLHLSRQPLQAPDEQPGPIYVELDNLNGYGIKDPTPQEAIHNIIIEQTAV